MLTDDDIRALRDKLIVFIQAEYDDASYNRIPPDGEEWEAIEERVWPYQAAVNVLNALLPQPEKNQSGDRETDDHAPGL